MSQLTRCSVLLLLVYSAIAATLDPVSIPGNGEIGTCPAQESKDAAIQNISASVRMIIQNNMATTDLAISRNCGAGEWHQVAHLNMSNSSQQCLSAWREYNSSGVRTCRRPHTSSHSCSGTFYATSHQYSRVCGRVIGYQIGSTDAFGSWARDRTIDSYYVYGVSVTHGTPRNHIWTLASGISEGAHATQGWDCPCSNSSHPNNNNVPPPSFVGNNYYCESGNPTNTYIGHHLYSTDPLWDGQQCEGECCSNGKSPPWFSVELPNPTTDDIEVRICNPQGSYNDVAIQLLELYIQYN